MKTTRILILLTAIILASCKSSKNAESNTTPTQTTPTTTITTPGKQNQQDDAAVTNFTAKVHATVNIGGKDITCPGNLRLRRGDVIQLSLADPFMGISEILRVEISPNDILLIDRYNKQYVQTTKDELAAIAGSYSSLEANIAEAISYDLIEHRIWDEVVNKDHNDINFDIPAGKPVSLNIRLSKKQPGNANWEAHTAVSPDKMRKVNINELIQSYSSAIQ